MTHADMRVIASMTTLTKLEFREMSPMSSISSIRPLWNLQQLRELSLAAWDGDMKDLIAPGILPSLERLRVDASRLDEACLELETWTLEETTAASGKAAKTWSRPCI